MRRIPWLLGLLSAVLILASVDAWMAAQTHGSGASETRCDITHEGDLIIWFNEVFTIEGITYCQKGSIYAHDFAKIVIKNGVLVLDQRYHYEFEVAFDDHSTLDMHNSSIESDYQFGLGFSGHSKGQVVSSSLPNDSTVGLHDSASLGITDSALGGVALEQWGSGTGTTDFATLTVENSLISRWIELVVAFSPEVVFNSLTPGHYDDWDLYGDNEVHNLPMNVTLIDTDVSSWHFEFGGSASASFEDCEVGHLRARDQSDIAITNSTINTLGFYFGQNQVIEVSGLKPGHLTDWTLQNLSEDLAGRQTFVLRDSVVRDWEIINVDAFLSIIDSEIGVLWTESGETRIKSSYVGTFYLHHQGTVVFEDAVVQSVAIFANASDQLSGSVKFLDKELHGSWHNAAISRQFPILTQDSSEFPLANVDLELYSPHGELIWTGVSNSEGGAAFEIIFNDDNYQDEWTLKAALPDGETITREIGFLTDTPIKIMSAREASAVSDVRCDITHEGDLILQGHDVLTIENETYCLNGNLRVSGSAKVILRRGRLFVHQAFLNDHRLFFRKQSGLEMDESSITSNYELNVLFSGSATALMIRSVVGGAKGAIIELAGSSAVNIQDSNLQVSPFGIVISKSANLIAEDSTINLHPRFSGEAIATLTSLRPGFYSDWNLHRDNDIQGSPFDIALINTVVEAWNVAVYGSATVTMNECELVHFGLHEQGKGACAPAADPVERPVSANGSTWIP